MPLEEPAARDEHLILEEGGSRREEGASMVGGAESTKWWGYLRQEGNTSAVAQADGGWGGWGGGKLWE